MTFSRRATTLFVAALAVAAALLLASGAASRSSAEPADGYLDLQGPFAGFMEVPHDTALNPTNAITIEAWVYLYSYGGFGGLTDCPMLVAKNWVAAYALGLACGSDIGDGYINGTELPGETLIPLATWTHLAMTFDGFWIRTYVNGELDTEKQLAFQLIGGTTDPLRIGHDVEWDFSPHARIDDVRIWSIARPKAHIEATMDGVRADTEGLIANWTFDAGSLLDRVSGRPGTLVGDVSVQIEPTPSPTPSPSPTASPTPTPTPSPTRVPTPTGSPVPPLAKGDIDCDQTIGPADVVALLGYLAEVSDAPGSCEVTPAGVQTWLDMECSGAVDSEDALVLLAHVGGVDMVPSLCLDIGTPPAPIQSPTPLPTGV